MNISVFPISFSLELSLSFLGVIMFCIFFNLFFIKPISVYVNKFSKKITLIIATHRISSAKKCDKILVLENGKVIEFGSHKELIKNKRYYSRAVLKQSS